MKMVKDRMIANQTRIRVGASGWVAPGGIALDST
jgi:hypothetical protein